MIYPRAIGRFRFLRSGFFFEGFGRLAVASLNFPGFCAQDFFEKMDFEKMDEVVLKLEIIRRWRSGNFTAFSAAGGKPLDRAARPPRFTVRARVVRDWRGLWINTPTPRARGGNVAARVGKQD